LTSRFVNQAVIQRIQSDFAKYNTSIEVEIQQRAVEYTNLFQFADIRSAVLERMPVPDIKEDPNRGPSSCAFVIGCLLHNLLWVCIKFSFGTK